MQWIMCAAFVVAWSSGFVGATFAETTNSSTWSLLAWRYVITALLLIAACLAVPAARRSLRSLSFRDVAQQIALSMLAHVLFLGGVFLAADRGLDAGLSALVCALQPLVVTAAGRWYFGDHVTRAQWAGLVIALAGVALSVGGIRASGTANVALVVLSLVGLSAASLLERAWQPRVSVGVSLTLQVSCAAVIFVAVAAMTGELALHVSGQLVLAISWLVALSGLGGYITFIWCLRHVGASTTSTLLYLTAPVTMLWAWAMFGQQPSGVQWLGLTVVLMGVYLTVRPLRSPSKRQHRQSHPGESEEG